MTRQRTMPREALVLSPAFDAIVDEVGSAIADLRRIAAGVRPARLDEGLLSGWLAFWRVPEPQALLVTDTTGLLVPRPEARGLLG